MSFWDSAITLSSDDSVHVALMPDGLPMVLEGCVTAAGASIEEGLIPQAFGATVDKAIALIPVLRPHSFPYREPIVNGQPAGADGRPEDDLLLEQGSAEEFHQPQPVVAPHSTQV
jgi:hypothetical protein